MSQIYDGPGAMARAEAEGTFVARQQRYPITTTASRAPAERDLAAAAFWRVLLALGRPR
jgi:hypothetical protein